MMHAPEPRSLLAAFAAWLLMAAGAAAQHWEPSKPVRIIVPFAVGGPSDTIARIIADGMTPFLGQQVYVENVPGEGGRTGVLKFLAEAGNAHTILMGHMGTHSVSPALNGNLGYDPETDFAPIGLVAEIPTVICTSKALDVSDMSALKTRLQSHARETRMAHAGRGSVSHTGALLLSHALKASPALVGYDGTGPALNDVVSGDISLIVDQIVNVAPPIMSRKIVPIAIMGDERSPLLPDVPTVVELGLAGLRMDAWNALFAKDGTPPEQVEAMSRALRSAHLSASTRARLMDLGAGIPTEEESSPAALRTRVANETRRWSATLYELRNDQALR